jgi:hypothetical protein
MAEIAKLTVNSRSVAPLQKSIFNMQKSNDTVLNYHFNFSNITKDNHYKGIDALVWSIAFA